jgi:hypothetical protein
LKELEIHSLIKWGVFFSFQFCIIKIWEKISKKEKINQNDNRKIIPQIFSKIFGLQNKPKN